MKLKKWVEYTIIFIQMILFVLLGSDCENTKLFIYSKIIILIIFGFNHMILKRYSRLYEEGEDYE